MTSVKTLLAGLSVLAAAGTLSAQHIEDLAPDNAYIVVGLGDMADYMEKARATPAWSVWKQPFFTERWKEMREGLMDAVPPEVRPFLEEMGLSDPEKNLEDLDLPLPTGSVGFAVFPVTNEETAKKEPGVLAFADFGENAERIDELISHARDAVEEQEKAIVDPFELLGRDGFVFEFEVPVPEEPEFNFGPPGMRRFMQSRPENGEPKTRKEKVYIVRDEARFFVCNDMISLGDALAQIDGDDVPDRFGETTAARDMFGSIGNVDAFAVVRVQPLIQEAVSHDPSGMAMMIVPMLERMIGKIDGAAFGMRVGGPRAMGEMPFMIYMPQGKSGLSALLNAGAQRSAELPRFVGPQSFSYTSMALQFTTLPAWFDQLLQNNPMLQMQLQQNQALEQARDFVRQLSETLGNEMHVAKTLQRPIEANSVKNVMAVKCTDTQGFEEFLTKQAAGMGLEGRDFLGQRIYAIEAPMSMLGVPGMPGGPGMGGQQEDMAIGIGAGYVVFGFSSSVEQALRSLADSEARTLQGSEAFARAMALLPDGDLVAWGYTDTAEAFEAEIKSQIMQQQRMIEQMEEEFGEEFANEMAASQVDNLKKFVEGFDFEALKKAYGPTVWSMRSTDNGFVGASLMLAPAEAE